MLYTLAVLTCVIAFLLLGELRYRKKLESFSSPRERAAYALPIIQGVFRKILKLSHVTVEVKGMENLTSIPKEEGVLFVGNHRSYFDVIIGYTLVDRPTGFIAKIEMEKIKPLRRWMEALGCLFMDRNNLKQSLKVIITAIKEIRDGISVWIYPEGTRSEGVSELEMEPFKEGSFKVAEKTGCKIVPVSMIHTREILETHFPSIKPQHIKVCIGTPIELEQLSEEEQKHIGSYVQHAVKADLKALLKEEKNA